MQGKIYKSAYIVIGDEILSGRTQDKNIALLGKKLNDAGIRLNEVRVIPDDTSVIIDTVKALSPLYDYIFTSGGIGPTHDDITIDALAKAFQRTLEINPKILHAMQKFYKERGQKMTTGRMKMAYFPHGAQLIENNSLLVPGFAIENVYVMAGIPRIFEKMLDAILPQIKGGKPIYSTTISSFLLEGDIAETLEAIQKKFPDISIGSYPNAEGADNQSPHIQIVLRGVEKNTVQKAARAVEENFLHIKNALAQIPSA